MADQFGIVFTMDAELKSLYTEAGINLAKTNGDDSWSLPLPATFIIEKDQTIAYRFVSADYTKRAEPADILKALQSDQHVAHAD